MYYPAEEPVTSQPPVEVSAKANPSKNQGEAYAWRKVASLAELKDIGKNPQTGSELFHCTRAYPLS